MREQARLRATATQPNASARTSTRRHENGVSIGCSGIRRHASTQNDTNRHERPSTSSRTRTRGKAVSQTGSAVRLVAVQPACSPRSNPPPGPGHNVRRCLSDAAAPAVTRRTGAAGIISGDYPAGSHTCGRLHRRPRRLRPGDLRLVTGTGSALGTGHSRGPRAPASTPYTLSIAR
jgi:hypothetical protein